MRTNVNNVEAFIRATLIQQSGLAQQYVRNALSMYGSYMSDSYDGIDWNAITPEQSLIFFELSNRDSDSDMSETRADGSIRICTSYQVHVIIYGDNSKNLANILIARLRTSTVRDLFIANEIYLESVSNSTSLNDYKNGALWQRNDFDINIGCEIKITQDAESYTFKEYSGIIVKTIEEAEQDVVQQG